MEEKVRPNVKTSWIEKPVSPYIHKTSNVDLMATVIGDVTIGERVNIAPGAVIRGDEGTPIIIGNDSNIQDNVTIHSLRGKGVFIGELVSIGHGSIIHGPVNIGNGTFIGFSNVIFQCDIGDNCVIWHNAVVSGNITIPNGKFIESGMVIDDNEKVKSLADVPENLKKFADEVVEINKELANGYLQLAKKRRSEKTIAVEKVKTIPQQTYRSNWMEFWQYLSDSLII
jgi:carbonic anhydrase/acetyltransferase-like protein (isoleucine patch superfamily)